MNQTQIACFFAAARSESFSVAADSVHMTPPTFGRQISSLERELGFLLFQRGWKNSRLTPAGEIMYEGLSALSTDYHLLVNRAMNADAGITGSIAFGMLEGQLVDGALQGAMRRFQDRFPGITFDLRRFSFHDLMAAVESGSLDAGVTLTAELADRPELDSMPLYRVESAVVISSSSPLAGRSGLGLADFAEETFVEIQRSDSPIISGLMRESCRQAGFTPKTLTVKDLKAQITAVELGQGIAAFNRFHQTCNHPGLAQIPVPELPAVEFSLTWNRSSPNPALPCLVTTFQSCFQQPA